MFKFQRIFSDMFSLKFEENKLNEEYKNVSYSSLKRFNFYFGLILTFISIFIFIFLLVTYLSSQTQFTKMNIHYENIKNTNLTVEDFDKIMIFYDKFVLKKNKNYSYLDVNNIRTKNSYVLEEKENSQINNFENKTNIYLKNSFNNNNNISNQNNSIYVTYDEHSNDYNYLKDCLLKLFVSRYCLYLGIFYSLLNFVLFLITNMCKKFSIVKLNFSIINVFLGLNFHILSGILRSYFKFGTETLFFIISIQLLIQVFISFYVKVNWKIILISSIFRSFLEIFLWCIFHFSINKIITFYFIVCIIGNLVSIVISYHKEISSKSEYFWNSKTKFLIYLMNMLYNFDQAFLSFKKNQVILMNKSMEKILKNNNIRLNSNENKAEKIVINNSANLIKDFSEIAKENNKIKELCKNNNKVYKRSESKIDLDSKDNNYDESNFKFIDSQIKSKNDQKENILDILLENFTEVNEELPDKIKKELKSIINEKSINSQLNNNSNSFCFKNEKKTQIKNKEDQNKKKISINENQFESNNIENYIYPTIKRNQSFNFNKHSNLSHPIGDLNLEINKDRKSDNLSKYTEILKNENIIKVRRTNINNEYDSKITNAKKIISLPSESNALKSNLEEILQHSNQKKLTMTKLIIILKENQQYIKKDSFLYIGKIILKKKKNSDNIDKKNSLKSNFILDNLYELRVRILKDKQDETMEIILNDVSVLIKKEREKAIDQCRSMYLLKTAHEFMNPITSSMELINILEEELGSDTNILEMTINKQSAIIDNNIENGNNYDYHNNLNTQILQDQKNKKKEILSYLKNLYFIMYNFLKDFTYFCEIKNICKACFIFEKCKNCKSESFCPTCNNCKKCNLKLLRDINLKQTLEEIFGIFSNIINFEGRSGLNIDLKYRVKELFIKFNPEYIRSIIFNIVYYFLKNGDATGDIEICVDYSNLEDTEKLNIDEDNILKNPDFKNITKRNNFEKNMILDYKNDSIDYEVGKKQDSSIKISIRTNNIKFEREYVRFNKNKEILNNLEAFGNLEFYGFDEFNKSFQIYIGIILSYLSNSTLNLKKITNGCEYIFECFLSNKQDKQDIFTILNSFSDSLLKSKKSLYSNQLTPNSNNEDNMIPQKLIERKNSKNNIVKENEFVLNYLYKKSSDNPMSGLTHRVSDLSDNISKKNFLSSKVIPEIPEMEVEKLKIKSSQLNFISNEQNNYLNTPQFKNKNDYRNNNLKEYLIRSVKNEHSDSADFFKEDDKKSLNSNSPISSNANFNIKNTNFSKPSKNLLETVISTSSNNNFIPENYNDLNYIPKRYSKSVREKEKKKKKKK